MTPGFSEGGPWSRMAEGTAEQHEWSIEETAAFVREQWKGFFHTHPQEQVRDPATAPLTVDLASFFTDTWHMDYHGVLQHLEKAYPIERVISPEHIQAEAERLSRETGRPAEELTVEVFEHLRQNEYHAPVDVEATAAHARQQSREGKNVVGGAEVDLRVAVTSDGTLDISTFTPEQTLDQLDLDYLVFSLHPDTDPLLKQAATDPEQVTKLYERMAQLAAAIREKNPHHPVVLGGHPLSRTEARHQLTRDQKERIIDAFTTTRIPLEISLNDYYWRRPTSIPNADAEMAEAIPLLDPEFLQLIRDRGTMIYIDTDLHFGGWLQERQDISEHQPSKLGRQPDDKRPFTAQTVADDLRGWEGKSLLGLPRYLRPQITRFLRVVRHLLRSGISPEQIVNTKSLDDIRELEGIET